MDRRGELEERQREAAPEPRAVAPPAPAPIAGVLAMQRSVGNAAVARALGSQQVLQRQPTQTQERDAMPRTDMGIQVDTGTTAELQAEQTRLQHIYDTESATLRDAELTELVRSLARLRVLLAERGNSTLADAGVELHFNGTELRMVGSSTESFPAVSGRPLAGGRFDYSPERQRQPNTGPIPEGVYWLDPRQLKDLWYYFGDAANAWGTHRITIHPFDTTATFGRGGFFIHGGTVAGSAGCIDLTSNMSRFAALLSAVPPGQKVKLHVSYPVINDLPAPQGDTRPV